ncbi:DoxX family protein [Luteimonas gilva]|uniref:DoxX family protein n=1 Tax=Luteimonas gilva TaxID=2572684 RepID=A0A4V6XUV7_9GAMM|nr:DoxX family protein [Luteimonas gilva]TKR33663.1 DoxX family protein [Luteimonas gilva]
MATDLESVLWLVGRFLLGGLFVVGGIHHFFGLGGLTQFMASRGVPAAKFVLIVGSVFQALAGLALIVGYQAFWAAIGLVVFTLIASAIFLNFWGLQGEARGNAIKGWQSNMAIVGGLLVAAAHAL